MSGPSDKARFYLEQSVPLLQEFRLKNIFSEEEIKALVKKRSRFEHRVVSQNCLPVDFARYAAWEIVLENLRQKRCKRLSIRSSTHSGKAMIINIFERGTKRHPGNLALWMSYLEYLKISKANKRFKTVLSSVIRLHPTKSELWLYAARWSLENESDINGARSYMQQGTRFCNNSSELWVEYAKLEMIFLSKIELRRKILQLDKKDLKTDVLTLDIQDESSAFSSRQDLIPIMESNVETTRPCVNESINSNMEAAKDPILTPALNGAIPMAIFDAAQKQSFFCASAAAKFFDMFANFPEVRSLSKILQHVIESMINLYPNNPLVQNCYTRQPIIGVNQSSPEFPQALGLSLRRINESLENVTDQVQYANLTRSWIQQILSSDKQDPAIVTVLEHTLRKLDHVL